MTLPNVVLLKILEYVNEQKKIQELEAKVAKLEKEAADFEKRFERVMDIVTIGTS